MIKVISISVLSMFLIGCAGTPSTDYSYYERLGRSHFPSQIAGTGKKTFMFSPANKVWAAYDEEGYRIRTGPGAGGSDECPEDGSDCRTVVGAFKVQRKGDADCTSSKYPLGEGGAPMAYCMHFHQGYAIHGAPGIPNVNQSHGCVRVMTDDARWLNEEFLTIGSNVIVEPYAD